MNAPKRTPKNWAFPLSELSLLAMSSLVKGTMEEVAAKLASSEGLPITKIGPAYRINNSAHPDSQIAFTDLLAIKFAETVNEGQKRAWLNDRGWTRVHETAHGRVFVRTHLEPTWQMIGVAQGLQSNDPMVDRAEYDFITTAELQFSNSLNFEDDLFEFQWPLFASGKNVSPLTLPPMRILTFRERGK